MPRKDYVPGAEALLWIFVDQFCTYAITHQVVLNFTVDQGNELSARLAAALAAKENVYDQRALYEAAIEVKDETKASLIEYIRLLAQKYQNDPDATDERREGLGITVPDTEPTALDPGYILALPAPLVILDPSSRGLISCAFGVNPSDENNNAKPPGIRSCEIFFAVGGIPNSDPEAGPWQYVADDSRSPYVHQRPHTASGTLAYKVRWKDDRNRPGPFCDPITIAYTA